jgi:cytochrome c oxidase assembly protein subunit 11
MYNAICEMTGINILALGERNITGRRRRRPANTQVDTSRTITVEFDANARGPWEFKPAQRSVQVHPGELVTVMYEFQNVQNRRMAAQAIPSYAPHAGGGALQQAAVLLLQPVHAGARREEILAGGIRHRSQAVA